MWKKSEEPADLTKLCFRAPKDNQIGKNEVKCHTNAVHMNN